MSRPTLSKVPSSKGTSVKFSGLIDKVFHAASSVDTSERRVTKGFIKIYNGKAAHDEIATAYKESLRVENLILYTTREGAAAQHKYYLYNIILRRSHTSGSSTVGLLDTMYSLHRSDSKDEATRMFHIYSQIFPELIKASFSPFNRQMLESIVKVANLYEVYTGVHIAAALNMVEQLKSPVFKGQLLKKAGRLLRTPLMVATTHGKYEAFQHILESDEAKMLEHIQTHIDLEGNTILHLAAACPHKVVGVKILRLIKHKILELGGPKRIVVLMQMFQIRNFKGFSPIHLSCIGQNLEAIEELSSVMYDTDETTMVSPTLLDITTSNGYTPLHLCTTSPAILSRLLMLEANPNIADKDGLTPLHKAVVMRELKSVLHLLANRADPNCRATSERYMNVTPLHLASGICDCDFMKILVVYGAEKGLKDGNGNTATNLVQSVSDKDPSTKQKALAVLSVNLEANNEKMMEQYRKMIEEKL